MKYFALLLALWLLVLHPADASAPAAPAAGPSDWPAYGGGPADTRYSPLDQINRENVQSLEVAWTYDTGEKGGLETSPIVVDGALYGITPALEIFALDAATGKPLWKFGSGIVGGQPNRGLTYWSSGDDKRIFAGITNFVYALDARSGKPIQEFGEDGRIDLRKDLGRDFQTQSIVSTSPGMVYQDLVIFGAREPEALPAPPGDVRAYDARTRKAALVLPHDSSSRRVRLSHLAEKCLAAQRRGQQLGRHGAR